MTVAVIEAGTSGEEYGVEDKVSVQLSSRAESGRIWMSGKWEEGWEGFYLPVWREERACMRGRRGGRRQRREKGRRRPFARFEIDDSSLNGFLSLFLSWQTNRSTSQDTRISTRSLEILPLRTGITRP